MARVKHNVVVNLKCKDCKPNFDRCEENIDSRCVIYQGETKPNIPAPTFSDMEGIIENITQLVDDVVQELYNLEEDFRESKTNIESTILEREVEAGDINERIDDVHERLTDLENRFCTLVEECPIVRQIIDRLNYIIDNLCSLVSRCIMGKDFPWVADENKSGCSYSNTEYIPAYGEPTGRTYYVETQKITDSTHPHYGQERVIWIPNKDTTCRSSEPTLV